MTDILGPASTNAVTARPARSSSYGATSTWFKDCSAPGVKDGTALTADWHNAILAQFRAVFDGTGILEDNGDDMLLRSLQSTGIRYSVDTGAANAMVATFAPAVRALTTPLFLVTKVKVTNTGATTLQADASVLAKPVVRNDGAATPLQAGDLPANSDAFTMFDGTNHILLSVLPSSAAPLYIIDTSIAKQVHGTGADFADLNAAMEYASKYTITKNGFLTLNVPAGSFAYSTNVVVEHAQGDRINITGAALVGGGAPPAAAFTCTGAGVSSDAAANLTLLRSRFATELTFAASTGFFVRSQLGSLANFLLTGPGTAGGNFGLSITPAGGFVSLNAVAASSFGVDGILIQNGFVHATNLYSNGNGAYGIEVDHAWLLFSGVLVCGSNNNGLGIIFNSDVNADTASMGTATLQGNANSGLYIYQSRANLTGANVGGGGPKFSRNTNGATGLMSELMMNYAVIQNHTTGVAIIGNELRAECTNADLATGNGASISITGASFVLATGSSVAAGTSPAVNTVGNGNSYIQQ